MRRALAVAVFVAALLVPPAALSAAPTNAQLQAEIKALQAKVTKQDKLIKKLQTDVNNAAITGAAALVFSACGLAITADADQGIFGVIDQIAVNTPNVAHTFFGPQTPIDDSQACTLLKIVRTQAIPPTTAAFTALFSLLKPPVAAAIDVLHGQLPTSWGG